MVVITEAITERQLQLRNHLFHSQQLQNDQLSQADPMPIWNFKPVTIDREVELVPVLD